MHTEEFLDRFYVVPGVSETALEGVLGKLSPIVGVEMAMSVQTELCYYVATGGDELTGDAERKMLWLLSSPLHPDSVSRSSFLSSSFAQSGGECGLLVEIGPRLNFCTAFSTNTVSVCRAVGVDCVTRVERSLRYWIRVFRDGEAVDITSQQEEAMVARLHDRMTQCRYVKPPKSFRVDQAVAAWYDVDVLAEGRVALEKASAQLGLGFDAWDLDYYSQLFRDKIGRNPTSVECFDLAQSNSEHSRHWFFKGRMVIDGEEQAHSLLDLIMATQRTSNANSLIAFCDNSSAIRGCEVGTLCPVAPGQMSALHVVPRLKHPILTAETHNFPTGVAPFPGAETGIGGRLRDVHATGRGAHVVAGTAGYSFGNLLLPGYVLPWEDASLPYPSNLARPLEVAVEASNGASDYGNKFGEPIVCGFARSFGLLLSSGDRREYLKPIMFTGGVGNIDEGQCRKDSAEVGMLVVKLGGPVYRLGVGGGAASSTSVQGDSTDERDFGAVQRGDAEMEQKLNRVIRACVEMGVDNPLRSIHDQGAGGNGNVIKELVDPAGAVVFTHEFELADPTISSLELWGAEYQENDAALVHARDEHTLRRLAQRERCPVAFVGHVTGDGRMLLVEGARSHGVPQHSHHPVDLQLQHVLGHMPCKLFSLRRLPLCLRALQLPLGLRVADCLERVLRLPSVASKRYLTNKVDRSVTGLVAQQQCVGPLHTPLADVAVLALSYVDKMGVATALGEQPVKGLLDAAKGARLSVAEAVCNLVWAPVSALRDVKCSANWMWPAKLDGEGALLYDACSAAAQLMAQLGIAVDGGKDSLSMAARVHGQVVKAPGTLVVSAYAVCTDVSRVATPDLKLFGQGVLVCLPLHRRSRLALGGSALAHCFGQLGDECPDLDEPALLVAAFDEVQALLREDLVSAGHDVSDGGLLPCLLEMAFAANCGLDVDVPTDDAVRSLFAEEPALLLELDQDVLVAVQARLAQRGLATHVLGRTGAFGPNALVTVHTNGECVLQRPVCELRALWEETSYQLERVQSNPHCADEEWRGLSSRTAPPFRLSFDPNATSLLRCPSSRVRVAVIREEGSNGDREMAAALHLAGFEVWDVHMADLASGSLQPFRGVVFVGGFSFADVLGSAKGWAATVLFSPLALEFEAFRRRSDTFSLGVCNGCQLMALLGWVAEGTAAATPRLLLEHNVSGRFESRFSTVRINDSQALMLRDMQGSALGVWVAHGEGRFRFRDEDVLQDVVRDGLVALQYVDDDGQPTSTYPLNPNGSPLGIAGLCSRDGRHLAMMPHPERCFQLWQWPWMPREWRSTLHVSPWMKMFRNAYEWCLPHS